MNSCSYCSCLVRTPLLRICTNTVNYDIITTLGSLGLRTRLQALHGKTLTRNGDLSRYNKTESFRSFHSSSIPRAKHVWPARENPSPYEIFNLPHEATRQQVRQRFAELVKIYHPDHARDKYSPEKFRSIVEANKILSSPSRRRAWDREHISQRASRRPMEWGTWAHPPPQYGASRESNRQRSSYSHWSRSSNSGPLRWGVYMSRWEMGPASRVKNAHFDYDLHFARNWKEELRRQQRDYEAQERMRQERNDARYPGRPEGLDDAAIRLVVIVSSFVLFLVFAMGSWGPVKAETYTDEDDIE